MLFCLVGNIYAEEYVDKLGLNEYVNVMEENISESDVSDVFNVSDITNSLMAGKGMDYSTTLGKILAIFLKEVAITIKSSISIIIILVVVALLKNLEIDEGSSVIKIADFVCFLSLSIILVTNFLQVIQTFKATCTSVTTLMQIISPFLMGILVVTGAITTTSIIEPIILFVTSLIGFIITNIVVPFLSISVSFNIIDSLNSKVGLSKLGKMFSSSSMWIVGVTFTVFLGILSLQTAVTSSVDSLAIKTTSAAVSNFVPVVGKFFSDSFETVVSAAKVVNKVGGVVGIISIIAVMIIPLIKIISIWIIYNMLSAIVEPICKDEKIVKIISNFADIYKTLSGILIGVGVLFIISIGIILSVGSSIIS